MPATKAPAADSTTVLGAGSWGTALAILLARNGRPTTLWSHDPAQVETMRQSGRNAAYLPDDAFPPGLNAEADLARAVAASCHILIVVPSSAFRQVLTEIAPLLQPYHRLMWGTKGLEPDSRKLLHQVAAEVVDFGWPLAVLSGPTFAREVARGLPTAITVASREEAYAREIATLLHGEYFRAYTSTDVVGVELGGATKNVLAIAAGIADGLGFGANTRAALITRGLAELMRLGSALGGHPETFMGLAGMGDLVLTCTDDQSRNRRAGLALGRGQTLEAALAEIGQVVEGVRTAREVRALSVETGVEMPITEQVYQVLYEGHDPHQAVHALLEREQKPESA